MEVQGNTAYKTICFFLMYIQQLHYHSDLIIIKRHLSSQRYESDSSEQHKI